MRGEGNMVLLDQIVHQLNSELDIHSYGSDPGFSRFIPAVYDPLQFDWTSVFENEFAQLFNGLMLRGSAEVENVFLAVFPTEDVLTRFIDESKEGDLLFMHHPLLMECGDPNGKSGRGFVPIPEKYLLAMKKKRLSVYTCHEPLDYHQRLGTSIAIAQTLHAKIVDGYLPNEKNQNLILLCEIQKTDTDQLIETLKDKFCIPYVDFEGKQLESIETIAIIAGCGDKVDWMKEAEMKGAQAYITGEIHCHIDNEYGRMKYSQMLAYVPNTTMSLIGVSHSASEYLVMRTLMKSWFEDSFSIQTVLLPQEQWWL